MNGPDANAAARSPQPGRRRYEVPSVAALADIRQSMRTWLEPTLDDQTLDEFLVVVSEVGANAVRATPPRCAPPVVEAHLDDQEVQVASTNQVAVPVEGAPRWDLADPLRAGGRGLLVVAAYADDVQIEPDGDSLTVRCTVGIGDPNG